MIYLSWGRTRLNHGYIRIKEKEITNVIAFFELMVKEWLSNFIVMVMKLMILKNTSRKEMFKIYKNR